MDKKKIITVCLTVCLAMEIVLPVATAEKINAYIRYNTEETIENTIQYTQEETEEETQEETENTSNPFLERYESIKTQEETEETQEKTESTSNPFLERYQSIMASEQTEQSQGASTYSTGDIAGAGAEQFSNIDFFITVNVNGREVTNMSEEIHNYVTLYAGTTSIPPLVTIDTSYPVHITYHSTITDLDHKTNQRILIKQANEVTLEGIYFERASTSVYPSLEFETAGAKLNFQGNNTFRVYSYGAEEETIKGLATITAVNFLPASGDKLEGTANLYVQEEYRGDYDSVFSGTIRDLENSREFGVTQAGATGSSGLMYISAITANGANDEILVDQEEDYFFDDVEYDLTTKTLTLKSEKKYAIRYSTYVNAIEVDSGAGTNPQMIFTTNDYSAFSSNPGSPFLKIYNDVTIILGANPVFTFTNDDTKYLEPTIKGADPDVNYTVSVRGYNKNGTYLSTKLNIYTPVAIDSNITISEDVTGRVILHPVVLPLTNSVFSVENKSSNDIKVVNVTSAVSAENITAYKNDGVGVVYRNINSTTGILYVLTDAEISISSSSGDEITTASSIRLYEGANVTFDNLKMQQGGTINTVLVMEKDVTINLVGDNSISTIQNQYENRPFYVYEPTGFKLTGSGNLDVYSTYGNKSIEGIINGSDNDKVNDKILEDAILAGSASGTINHYNLLNYPSAIAVNIEKPYNPNGDALETEDYLITTDKFSYDGYYLGVHSLDEITIGGSAEFGVYVNVPDAKVGNVVKINIDEAEMDATPGTSRPYIVTNTETEFIVNGWLALIDEDNAYLNASSNLLHIYNDFHFTGDGIVYVISNAGVVPVKIENEAEITADKSLKFIPYTYTGNAAVQASEFSITAVGEEVTADNFLSLSTTAIAEPFPYVATDNYTVRPITFFGEAFKESNGNVVNNMLLINTEQMVIIENKDQSKSTTHLIGVQEGLSSANIVFKGINIDVSGTDANLPLLYLLSDTNITLFSGYDNKLTVKYDVGSPSTVPTVMIADDKNLNIIENGGTLTMNSRYGASAVGGTMNNATPGASSDSFNSVTLNDINVTTKDPSVQLSTGDVTFENNVLTIKTNTEIVVSSVNPKISSNIRIEIPSVANGEESGTANVTFKDLNIDYVANSVVVNVSRDTDLFIEGDNIVKPYVVSGQQIYGKATFKLTSSTLNIYGTDNDKLYLGQARYRGAGIDVDENSKLNIYGSQITGTPGSYYGSVIGTDYDGGKHGEINIYGGIFYLGAGQSGRAIGAANATAGSVINILGGEIHLVNEGVIGSYNTEINIGNADGGSAIIYHYNDGYNADGESKFLSFFYNKTNVEDWNGMIAVVPKTYSQSVRYGHYKVFGDFDLEKEDFTIATNETLRFYTDNIAYDFEGFENGVKPVGDDTNYSMINVNIASGLVNNGTIYRNAYFYQNPHLGNITPTGTGVVEISITDYIVQIVPNTTGIYDCYRGNSLFDYYTIQENGVNVADIEGLSLLLYKGTDTTPLSDYIITGLGAYSFQIKEEVLAISTLSVAPVSIANKSTYNFTNFFSGKNETVTRALAIGSTDISKASAGSYSIDFGDVYYRGDSNPYTAEELLEKLIFTFDNREMVKGIGGDYIPKLLKADEETYYNDSDTFVDVQKINAIVSAVSTVGYADSIYNYGETLQNYAGYIMTEVEILPRSVQDPNVTLDNFAEFKIYDDNNTDNQNEQNIDVYYTYNDTKQLLVLGKDYNLTYYKAGTDTVISSFAGIGVGEVTVKITGLGNFTGVLEKTYKLKGDIGELLNIDVTYTSNHGFSDYHDTALEIGLGGRPDPDDIKIVYGTTPLEYGVDYTLDYASATYIVGGDTYPAISIIATGINNYTGVIKEENVPYYINASIKSLDTSKIYFRPDNTLDVSLIDIYETNGTLVPPSAYEIISTKGSSSDTTIIEITIKANGLLDGKSYYYNFEIKPQPAGSGTENDFAKGEIHLVETVYQRLDGTYHLEDDLVLWVTDGSNDLVMLEKDTDYTISIVGNSATVTAKGSVYTGKVTFDFETDVAGSGTGLDVFKGIIDLVEPIQIPGNADSQSTEAGKKATLLEEIQENIKLVVDGYTLVPNEHFEVEIKDWSTIIDNNKLISNTVQVNVTGKGELTGETKEFYVNLVSSTTFVNTDNLYIKPDYTVDIHDITLIHPVYKTTLTSSDYVKLEAVWDNLSTSIIKDFVAVKVTYSQTFIVAINALATANNLSAKNFIARVDTDNSVSYFVSAKTAGTGTNIKYGLIDIAQTFYYRPDGKIYLEDIYFTVGDGTNFRQGFEYTISTLVENDKWDYVNAGNDGLPSEMTHSVTVQGLVNDDKLGGSNTFYVNILPAGSGSGTDFANGIIENVPTIYERPDGNIYIEDLRIYVDSTRLVLNTDYTIESPDPTNRTITIKGAGKYSGEITFGYTTAEAGSNADGLNDISNGIIYKVYPVSEREGVLEGVFHIEDLTIQVNGGAGYADPITLEYGVDYDVKDLYLNEANSKVTLVGKGDYAGSQTTFNMVVIPYNSSATHVATIADHLKSETIYQRPDGKYYFVEDLVLHYYNNAPDTTTIELGYGSDYYVSTTASGTYTIHGLGNYRGTVEDVSGTIIYAKKAGDGVGYDVRQGIIYEVNQPIVKTSYTLTSAQVEEQLSLTVNKGTTPQQTQDAFSLGVDYYVQKVDMTKLSNGTIEITIAGDGSYTNTTTFGIDVEDEYKRPSSNNNNDVEEENTGVTTPRENPFDDVFETDWFYEDVLDAYYDGLMLGTSETIFSPYNDATRAMIVQVLYRVEGEPNVVLSNVFEDVNDNAWYAKAVTWAQQNGIVYGVGENLYKPEDKLTREQIVAILARYTEYKEKDDGKRADLSEFTDSDEISAYALDNMQWAVENEIIKGKTDTTIDPRTNATRAEIATIINRYNDLFLK